MNSKLQITEPLVSVDWLAEHCDAPNLVVIHASLKKITSNQETEGENFGIKNARFLDIKTVFSDTLNSLPNTMLSAEQFQEQARILGIDKDSAIVVYDTIGIYSSPRVWWMFKAMGHSNVAVLNGGLPEWIRKGFEIYALSEDRHTPGDFSANYDPDAFVVYEDVLGAINDNEILISDARSYERFMGLVDEPRVGLRAGHIPTSKNIPYTILQEDGKMIDTERLMAVFNEDYTQKEKVIFSCGSGITACILALGAELSGVENLAVYDGSWTEWGSKHELPIKK